MEQKHLAKSYPLEKDFYLRGIETTRLDTFIDAAFAFATTMLVISIGNVPKSFSELTLAFKGIPSFLASFATIVLIWYGHRKWSRRYGIEDNFTILLSFALVFILMIYIYPLRLVFSALFAWISGNYFPSEFSISSTNELANLFVFYGFGFAAIALLLCLLFYRAIKLKYVLKLNEVELLITKYDTISWLIMGNTALVSAFFAIIMPIKIAVFAGLIYSTLPFTMPAISIYFSKKVERIKKANS